MRFRAQAFHVASCFLENIELILLFMFLRADPLSNMVLAFSTKEDAVAFAEKNGTRSVFKFFMSL